MLSKKNLMSPSEVSQMLGIPEATLYQWTYRGVGPRSFRVGRHRRYRIEDVEEWLEARARGGDHGAA
ncbi:helix-turn-helix domain-containing protein [Streptomyces aidingensis]|uniref:DNA binding domain-containing protein, excisionase family n=1 Tax=Streptomyces aidingensis TaxID=910347 RepID=A0A1I1SH13_9ACTN|nr:helix-turn-helix domain-containing protein [Streptomyces aidingensis]SFD42320.1 DNA binding domain-containing protein, excisionase family [Streptomyces aidingensis]